MSDDAKRCCGSAPVTDSPEGRSRQRQDVFCEKCGYLALDAKPIGRHKCGTQTWPENLAWLTDRLIACVPCEHNNRGECVPMCERSGRRSVITTGAAMSYSRCPLPILPTPAWSRIFWICENGHGNWKNDTDVCKFCEKSGETA